MSEHVIRPQAGGIESAEMEEVNGAVLVHVLLPSGQVLHLSVSAAPDPARGEFLFAMYNSANRTPEMQQAGAPEGEWYLSWDR